MICDLFLRRLFVHELRSFHAFFATSDGCRLLRCWLVSIVTYHIPLFNDSLFNAKAGILRQYLSVVLANKLGIFFWEHRDFGNVNSGVSLLSFYGAHRNLQGQYILYLSYCEVILKALHKLHKRYRGYYMVARRYGFYVRVSAANE